MVITAGATVVTNPGSLPGCLEVLTVVLGTIREFRIMFCSFFSRLVLREPEAAESSSQPLCLCATFACSSVRVGFLHRSSLRGTSDVSLCLDPSPRCFLMKKAAPPLPAERPGGSRTEPALSFTASGPQDKYTTASLVALDNICPHT